MARRATDLHPHPFATMIRQAWKDSELPLSEVVFRYKTEALARGYGAEVKGDAAVKRWCYGWSIPQLHQYDILLSIFNPVLEAKDKPLLMTLSNANLYWLHTPFHQGFRGLPRTNRRPKVHFPSLVSCSQ